MTHDDDSRPIIIDGDKPYLSVIPAGETSRHELVSQQGNWEIFNIAADRERFNAEFLPLLEKSDHWHTSLDLTDRLPSGPLEYDRYGDFYVYFSSNDPNDKRKTPAAIIHMNQDRLQMIKINTLNQDLKLEQVIEQKVREFPSGNIYLRMIQDNNMVIGIAEKVKNNETLNKADLEFLYEVKGKMQAHWREYNTVKEIRLQRSSIDDACMVFNCTEKQIARDESEINNTTKVYIGPLFPGFHNKLASIENIYTSFPQGKVVFDTIETTDESLHEVVRRMEESGIEVSYYAKKIINAVEPRTARLYGKATKLIGAALQGLARKALTGPSQQETPVLKTRVVKISLLSMMESGSVPQKCSYDDVLQAAQELGLELCPAGLGVRYRDQYLGPTGEAVLVGMPFVENIHQEYKDAASILVLTTGFSFGTPELTSLQESTNRNLHYWELRQILFVCPELAHDTPQITQNHTNSLQFRTNNPD